MNRIERPSLYIGVVMLLWGMISTLSGITTGFSGMVATRFFLGFVEAAFLPGALLILSKWYTRRELTTRNAILFCGNLISNAFSALIAAGVLSNMQGVLGHAAWRWLFWSELNLLTKPRTNTDSSNLQLKELRPWALLSLRSLYCQTCQPIHVDLLQTSLKLPNSE
jgi:MFS family permease